MAHINQKFVYRTRLVHWKKEGEPPEQKERGKYFFFAVGLSAHYFQKSDGM